MTLMTSSQTPEAQRIKLMMTIKPLVDDLRQRFNINGLVLEYEQASFVTFKVVNKKSLDDPTVTTYGRIEFPHELNQSDYFSVRVRLFDTGIRSDCISFESFPKSAFIRIFNFHGPSVDAGLYRANIERLAQLFSALRNFSSRTFVIDGKKYFNKF